MNKQAIIDECLAHFKTVFPEVALVPIKWNPRMRSCAGKVKARCLRIGRSVVTIEPISIELNSNLLIDETKLKSTFLHELAHLAEMRIYKKGGHGRTWKHCMQLLGQDANRCHKYDVTKVRRKHKRVAAMQCSCQTIEITMIRFKKILNGTNYRCISCKQTMKIVDNKKVA